MKGYQSLSHARWDCKCHVVFIPERKKGRVFGALRKQLVDVFQSWRRTRNRRSSKGI